MGRPRSRTGSSGLRLGWVRCVHCEGHGVRPNDRDAHFFRGVNLLTKGLFAAAAEAYERAAELDPLDPLMASHLATALWCSGNQDAGEKIFVRVIEEFPNFADAHGLRALGLSRDDPIYRAREALGLRRAGRPDEARAIVEEVQQADLSTLSNVRAVAALAVGDDVLALEELAVAIEERQPMPLWMRVGRFFDESDPRVRECFAPMWQGRWGEDG